MSYSILNKFQSKVQLCPVHTVKVYRGPRRIAPLLLTSAFDGSDCLGSDTGRLTLGRGQRSLLNRILRVSQNLFGLPEEQTYFLLLPGLELRAVQTVTRLYRK
jgi:hypothetical protein